MTRCLALAVLAAALLAPGSAQASLYGDGIRTTAGVAAYWPLDETAAPVADLVGNRTATPSFGYALGRPPGIDAGGTSMTLTGTAAVTYGNVDNFAADRTIEAWVAPTTTSGDRYIVSKGTTTAGYHLYLAAGGIPTFQVNGSRATAPALAAGRWHQIVASLTGRTMTLYVDGVTAGSGTVSNAPATSTQSLYLGRLSRSSSGWFQGGLDEISMYSRALDATTVAAHFAAGADTTPPRIVFTSPLPPASDSSDGTITFTGSKGGVTFTCALDDAAASACPGTFAYDLLRDGPHSVTITATDRWGTTASSTLSWPVALPPGELAPPETVFGTGPAALTNATTAQLAFSGNKTRLTFACRLDGGAWTACAGTVAYSGLADRQHTVDVRATDRWGSVEQVPASYTWRVDLAAPETLVVLAKPTAGGPGVVAAGSEPGARFECKPAAGQWGSCASTFALPAVSASTTMQVRAVDGAGNADATPVTVAVDPSPAADPDGVTASFALGGARSASGLQCQLDDRPASACPSPLAFSGLAFGTHRLAVSDPALPEVAAAVIAWVNARPSDDELAAPVTTLTVSPQALSNSASARFEFTGSKLRVRFACRIDAGAWVACPVGASYANLAEGTHTFEVRGTDRYGTVEATPRAFTWKIDLTPPDTFVLAAKATPGDPGSVALGSEAAATFECHRTDMPWAACPASFAMPVLTGPEQLFVRAVDAAGNADPAPAQITLDPPGPEAPVAFGGGRAAFVIGGNRTVAGLGCSLDGAPVASCPWPLDFGDLSYGAHTLTVSDPSLPVVFPTISWAVPLPRPRIVGSQFPALLPLGSRKRQATLAKARLPRLLFQSNSAGSAQVTLRRGRSVRGWKAPVVQGSNLVRLPRSAYSGLRPGRYRLVVVVTNAAGASVPLTLRFDAVRGTRR